MHRYTVTIVFISICALACGSARQDPENGSIGQVVEDQAAVEEGLGEVHSSGDDNVLPPLKINQKKISVEGRLSVSHVEQKVTTRLMDIQACLEEQLSGPFSGVYEFTFSFEVLPSGKVTALQLATPVDAVKACLSHFMSVLNSIEFNTAEDGSSSKVVCPMEVTRGMYF